MRSAAQPEEVLLEQLPIAVLVRLHDCKHVFLPCEPCGGCEAFNSLCEKCGDKRKDLEEIFAVQPISRSWTYDGPELKGQYVNWAFRQDPCNHRGGPPDGLVQTFNTLFQDKAGQTLAAALEARGRLGW